MSQILIVDDSSVIRKVLCRIFDGMQCVTHVAETRAQALECVEKNKPDVMIIDWQLPDEGPLALIKAVRKLPSGAKMRFFVCNAIFTQDDIKIMREAGIEDVILKPFDRHHIWKKFETLRPAA